jgi:hypothetical protein
LCSWCMMRKSRSCSSWALSTAPHQRQKSNTESNSHHAPAAAARQAWLRRGDLRVSSRHVTGIPTACCWLLGLHRLRDLS